MVERERGFCFGILVFLIIVYYLGGLGKVFIIELVFFYLFEREEYTTCLALGIE